MVNVVNQYIVLKGTNVSYVLKLCIHATSKDCLLSCICVL